MPNLTKEQQDVVRSVIKDVKKGDEQVISFSGAAGCGKTTCINVIAQILPNFAICAYTGKAASTLRKKGMFSASTIHSLIYKPMDGPKGIEFVKKPIYEIGCEGFIVDEASMVDKILYQDLISYNLPLIVVGDKNQLEPVGQDIYLMANPMYKLETIHRNAGEIAFFADHLRKGKNPRSFECGDKVKIITPNEVTDDLMLSTDQMICAFNRFRVEKNDYIRKLKGYNSLVEKGDRVMCLRNNRMFGLFNGMQGEVLRVDRHRMDFKYEGIKFENLDFDPNQFGKEKNQFEFGVDTPHPFDYAYCVTAHKCIHPETMVETSCGFLPIKCIAESGLIATPNGIKEYCNFVKNGASEAIKFTTEDGYGITVTPEHKVEIWDGNKYTFVEAKEVVLNNFFRLKLGTDIDSTVIIKLPDAPEVDVRAVKYALPTKMSRELAEFFGLMVADGTIWDRGFRLVKRHKDVTKRFGYLCELLFGAKLNRVKVKNATGYEVDSTFLSSWLMKIGGMMPNAKDVPLCILQSPLDIQTAFLHGLFEDGTVNMNKNGAVDHIEFFSAFPDLLNKVKPMLLRLNIVTGCTKNRPEAMYIFGKCCKTFRDSIGFISKFKQDRLGLIEETQRYYHLPVSREEINLFKKFVSEYDVCNARQRGHITKNVAEKVLKIESLVFLKDRLEYHHVRVEKIEKSFCESMCVEVPDGHVFFQNGFPFGNSQSDEWGSVLVFEQQCDKWDHKRWIYTCASRAKELLMWVCEKRLVPKWLK